MAIHTNLPIYKVAYDLLDAITDLVKNMPRDIQRQCQHEFKWKQTAGEGRTCTKCQLWDLDCDD
ncbi:MAG: hypothetical protein WBC07_08345 [Methylotenera sp.]